MFVPNSKSCSLWSFLIDLVFRTLPIDIEQSQSNYDEQQDHPPELIKTFKRLHHFRRGTILGSSMQSTDDRSLLRDLFLRMPTTNCLSMMAPSLWMYKYRLGACNNDDDDDIQPLMEVPAETLSMWDNVSNNNCFQSVFLFSYSTCRSYFVIPLFHNIATYF